MPILCGDELPLRVWFGLVALAVQIGWFEVQGKVVKVKAGTLQLAKFLFNLQDEGGDDWGAGGWFPFRRHSGPEDLGKHYCATHGYANIRTFYRHFGPLEKLGLIRCIDRPTNTHKTAVYEMCLRGDSPLIARLPASLAKAVRVHELARLLGERDLPDHTAPAAATLSDVVAGYVPTVALAERDAASAANLKKISDLEIAMLHATTPRQEELILAQAEALDHGWAHQDGTPAPGTQARPDAPSLLAPAKRTQRRIPGSLKASLGQMRLVKRTAFGFTASPCQTTPISHDRLYPSGSVISSSLEPTNPYGDGRSRAKAAPTARNINGGAGTDGAWRTAGMPIPGLHSAGAAQARWDAENPTQDEREAALATLQQVYAMWKRRRPRQTLIGTWVEGTDGTAVFEPGEGYADLRALIGMALARTTRTDLLDMAAKCCGENVESPVGCLAARLWKLVENGRRHGEPPKRKIIPGKAVLAQDEQGVSAAEYARIYNGAQAAKNLAFPDRVAAPDTSSAEDLKAVRGKTRADGVAHKAAADAAQNKTPEKVQARREHLAARTAAIEAEKAEMERRKAAADAALDKAVQAETEQRAVQDAERAREEAEALAEHQAKRHGVLFDTEHHQDEEHAAAHARAKRDRKAKQLAAQSAPPAPAVEAEAPKQPSWVAGRLARWAGEGIARDLEA